MPLRAPLATLLLLASCGNEGNVRTLVPVASVQPGVLAFPDVGPPLSATLPLYVENAGDADLQVTLAVDGIAFAIDTTTLLLEPNATAEVAVTFTPPTLLPYDGVIHLDTNDPERPTLAIPLTGTGVDLPLPDIEIFPAHTLELDGVAVGSSQDFVLEVRNAGDAALVLGDIAIASSSVFTVRYAPSGFTLGPGDSDLLVVAYAPTGTAGDVATIDIPSNDPDEPAVTVVLIGNGGGDFERPVAVIDCPADLLLTGPEWLQLDGSGSFDPAAHEPLAFAWAVAARPAGSDTDIAIDPADTAEIDLYVDVAGTWSVELVVTNTLGTTSEPATCTFDGVPEDDLHVELSWDTSQADVDLHLVQAGSSPFECPGDCYYSNRHPDWGVLGDPDDDARLDIDDTVGFGPENINVLEPPLGTYDVFVHLYDPHGDAVVTPTVQVWLGGLWVWTGSAVLDEQHELWTAGTITWPAGTFVASADPHVLQTPSSCD